MLLSLRDCNAGRYHCPSVLTPMKNTYGTTWPAVERGNGDSRNLQLVLSYHR